MDFHIEPVKDTEGHEPEYAGQSVCFLTVVGTSFPTAHTPIRIRRRNSTKRILHPSLKSMRKDQMGDFSTCQVQFR